MDGSLSVADSRFYSEVVFCLKILKQCNVRLIKFNPCVCPKQQMSCVSGLGSGNAQVAVHWLTAPLQVQVETAGWTQASRVHCLGFDGLKEATGLRTGIEVSHRSA